MANHNRGGRRGSPVRGGLHRPTWATSMPHQIGMAALVVLVVMGVGCIGLGLRSPTEPPSRGVGGREVLETAGVHASRGLTLVRSAPIRLDVPSVGIHTRLVKLGLNADDTLEVPSKPLLAGWYTGSPTPGERGPSVIAGHVDSWETGPAVFYRLGQVIPGARIDVTRIDGSIAHFNVTATRAYPKRDFPTRAVYGNTDRATLRLITCGDWNEQTQEYDGNVVVFAELNALVS